MPGITSSQVPTTTSSSTTPAVTPMTPPIVGVSIPASAPAILSPNSVTPITVAPPSTIPPTAQPPLPVETPLSPPPLTVQPPMSAPQPVSLPVHTALPKWPLIAIGVVAVLALAIGGYYFWSNNMAAVTQPIGSEYQESTEKPQEIVPATTENTGLTEDTTSTAKIAALSKNYSGTALPLQFNYPETWFLEESEQRVSVQNFDPATAPAREYIPEEDKGNVRLIITPFNAFDSNAATLAEFTSKLHQEDQQVCLSTGDPMGKTIVDKEEEITSTAGMQILHRIDHCERVLDTNENYYLINGQGKMYEVTPILDTTAEVEIVKAIVQSIKF